VICNRVSKRAYYTADLTLRRLINCCKIAIKHFSLANQTGLDTVWDRIQQTVDDLLDNKNYNAHMLGGKYKATKSWLLELAERGDYKGFRLLLLHLDYTLVCHDSVYL
jgi:hypothetical protein